MTGKAWRNRDSSRLNDRKGGVIWGELVGIGSRLASSGSWLTSRIGEWARVGAECEWIGVAVAFESRLCRSVDGKEENGLWRWRGCACGVEAFGMSYLVALSVMSCGAWC